ncbi:hypothetical protein D9M71_451530 [compost metagenome]
MRILPRPWIGSVIATGDAGDGFRVGHGQGEDRDAVDRATGRHQPGIRQPALGRLEPDDIVEARRHPTRASRVGPQRERHQPARHHRGGTGTGTAADVFRLEGVAHRAIGRTGADQAGGELVEVGLADQDGAGRAQAGDHGRIGFGAVGELRAGGGGGPAGGVDIVLDGERHAVQRQLLDLSAGGVEQGLQLGQLRIELPGAGQADPGVIAIAQLFTKGVQQFGGLQLVAVGLLPVGKGEGERGVGHALRSRLVSKMG